MLLSLDDMRILRKFQENARHFPLKKEIVFVSESSITNLPEGKYELTEPKWTRTVIQPTVKSDLLMKFYKHKESGSRFIF